MAGSPTCPWCGAAWTADMLRRFDEAASGVCSCCGPPPAGRTARWPIRTEQADLACARCGRVLFQAPPVARD